MIPMALIGKSSHPVANDIEKGAIRRFAEAIGDPNPLYRDEDFAKNTRYGNIIAPPTFSRTFEYGEIEGLAMPKEGLIHGEQEFTYAHPIFVGDVIYCSRRLVNVYERNGKSGKMTFVVFEQEGRNQAGRRCFTALSTVIIREQKVVQA